MPPTKYDKKPKPGDLIEIFRGGYQHWAIYVGGGFVIHLAPPSEYAQAGSYSMMSVTCDRAFVRKEKLSIVAGPDKYQINNLLDEEYGPRPIEDIIKDAERLVGSMLQYSLTSSNCEHFVTELRYGKPESRQVRSAVGLALAGTGLVAGVAALAYAFSSGDKEKQTK